MDTYTHLNEFQIIRNPDWLKSKGVLKMNQDFTKIIETAKGVMSKYSPNTLEVVQLGPNMIAVEGTFDTVDPDQNLCITHTVITCSPIELLSIETVVIKDGKQVKRLYQEYPETDITKK